MKCSFHADKKFSLKHNYRDYDKSKWNQDGHIDDKRSYLNKVYVSQSLYDFFDKKFGKALENFNAANVHKHPDRLIGFSSAKEYNHQPLCPR